MRLKSSFSACGYHRCVVHWLRSKMLITACFLAVLSLDLHAQAAAAREPVDVRLLIDISGSMKKNDPGNLRIPAVNLLTELVPSGDKAGVWTFGQSVNNLIKHQVVDDKWRQYAKQEAKKINSVALFTNIGAALEKASADLAADKRYDHTHFILLTDGMVDIDPNAEKNAAERERILGAVVNRIRERGAHIHTVALSENADRSLMDKLAVLTGGQAATANTPEDLTRIFLQALDQAVPKEQIPLEGNRFDVDSTIEEFTALIFRGESGAPTVLRGPDQQVHSASKRANYVKWFQQAGYDLITVERPMEGAWEIRTDVGPGSRVTVVSNLQLLVNKLPVNFFSGQTLPVEVSFAEAGKRITNADFLKLMDVDLIVKTEEGKQAKKTLSDPAQVPADGIFRDAITKLTDVGQYEVTVAVDGKTFKRQYRQLINLKAPFDFEFSVTGQGSNAHYTIVVTPLNDTIDTQATKAFARIKGPDDTSLIKALDPDPEGRRWRLSVHPDKGDGVYNIGLRVKAVDKQGKEFEFTPKSFDAEFPIPAGAAAKIVSINEPEPAPEPVPEAAEEAAPPVEELAVVQPEPVPEPLPEEAPAAETDWALWIAIIGGGVALLALVGGALYYRKRNPSEAAQTPPDEEVLTDTDVKDIMDDPAATMVTAAPLLDESIADELDFVEEPDSIPTLASDLPDEIELAPTEFDEPELPVVDDEVAAVEELLAAELAASDSSEESEPAKDEAEALDLEQALASSDDDDDDEFNLEDFDIGETEDLPDPDKKNS